MYRFRRPVQALLLALLLIAGGGGTAPGQPAGICDQCWLQCDLRELECLLKGWEPCTLCSCDFIYGWCYTPACCEERLD